MTNLFKKVFFGKHTYYDLAEGIYAHQYKDEKIRRQITEEYNKTHLLEETPLTHPSKYHPLNPPEGWAYDPYYALWIRIK
jgi:hypothetical protein